MDPQQFIIDRLGECLVDSPMKDIHFTTEMDSVLYHGKFSEIQPYLDEGKEPPAFEMAGPREKIFFDPQTLCCGIVTCGGLCPGLNDVIRAVVRSLHHITGLIKLSASATATKD